MSIHSFIHVNFWGDVICLNSIDTIFWKIRLKIRIFVYFFDKKIDFRFFIF